MNKKFDFTNVISLTKNILQTKYFEKALKPNLSENKNCSNLLLITGENASGKSFIRRLFQVACKKYSDIECIVFSQEGRSSNLNPLKCFIYGSETDESTGAISCNFINTTFKSSKERTNKHLIIFDEPEIGLSDSYAAGVGQKINEFVKENWENVFGIIIISHNKCLIKQLLKQEFHHLRLGDNKTLNDFLKERVKPKNPEELIKKASQLYQDINKLIEI